MYVSKAAMIQNPTKGVTISNTNASVLLDLVRGLAALLVLLEHWRNIFFIDYPQIIAHRALLSGFYLLCTAGHQAVVIFFVLSGYLISGSIFRMLQRQAWSWRSYLTHRLVRLWVVLVPGLLLCALWDGLGLHSGLAPELYAGLSGDNVIAINVAAKHSWGAFASNLLFLQTIHHLPIFGSDESLWSLANEFWYYILFPLGLFAILRRTPLPARLLCALSFAALAWFVGSEIFKLFPIWLLGSALALVPVPQFSRRVRILAAALYIPVLFLLGRKAPLPVTTVDYILALATVLFLWVLLSAGSAYQPSSGVTLSRELSKFSYTLYVAHMPLCVLLAALLVGETRWAPTPAHLVYGLLVLCGLLAYAYGVARLTEFRTDRVRSWVEARLRAHEQHERSSATWQVPPAA